MAQEKKAIKKGSEIFQQKLEEAVKGLRGGTIDNKTFYHINNSAEKIIGLDFTDEDRKIMKHIFEMSSKYRAK